VTKNTPFFANYGFHPSFDPQTPSFSTIPRAELYVKELAELSADLSLQIEAAKKSYQEYANRTRMLGPNFTVGDLVWLSSKNVKTNRPCKKLDAKRLGPFPIQEKYSDTVYKLQLPATLAIHPVFHVSLLEPHQTNDIPGRKQPPPPPVITENGEEEFEVQQIVDSKFERGVLKYLIDWVGYGPEEISWQPASHVSAPECVADFHHRYPEKPGPLKQTSSKPSSKPPKRRRSSRVRGG
jgi:hypothetical protein